MKVYAESSAIVAWLFDEASAGQVEAVIAMAGLVIGSELTLLECERALHRAVATSRLNEFEASRRQDVLLETAGRWHMLHLDAAVFMRARQTFPTEPVRTLDALHLASALAAREDVPGLVVLSLDERVRRNALALGFRVLPEDLPT